MSKHKAFKRALKKPYFGLRYYRIWGWPLEHHNVRHHQHECEKDSNKRVFQFGATWVTLFVFEEFVGSAYGVPPYRRGKRYAHARYQDMCSAVTVSCIFKTKAQALKRLDDYAAGRTQDGLHSLLDFHQGMDGLEDLWDSHDDETEDSDPIDRQAIINMDPVALAEEHGLSDIDMLALAAHKSSQERKAALSAGDTTVSDKLSRYIQVITTYGFEHVKTWQVSQQDKSTDLMIYVHRAKGLVLAFDTFVWEGKPEADKVLNGGNVFYQWQANDIHQRGRATSSGSWTLSDEGRKLWEEQKVWPDDAYWSGNHDCRSNLIFNLNGLEATGKFLPTWNPGHMYGGIFLAYPDYNDELQGMAGLARTKTLAEQRYAEMPEWFRQQFPMTF